MGAQRQCLEVDAQAVNGTEGAKLVAHTKTWF